MRHVGPLVLAAAVAIASIGCATEPRELPQIRDAYDRLAANAQVRQQAGVELHDAELAVDRAFEVWQKDGNYDESVHLAYLATRRIEIAQLATERRELEDEIEQMPRQRVAQLAQRDHLAASMRGGTRLELSAGDAPDLDEFFAKLEEEPDERGVVTLGDVLFGFDSDALKGDAEKSLGRLSTFLAANQGRSVLVEGHTDDTGILEYNFDLSRRRADHVRDELVKDGVDPERVLTVGYGPVYPVAPNTTATGRAQNRRVEIVVLGRGEALDPAAP